MGNKFVYKFKDDVDVPEEGTQIMGHGVFTKDQEIESLTPIENANLELVSEPDKQERKVGLDPKTEPKK